MIRARRCNPGAPQLCDGINNDCGDPSWPAVPANEFDGDGDAFRACADCNDADPNVHRVQRKPAMGSTTTATVRSMKTRWVSTPDGDGIPNACDPCMDLDLDGYAYQDGCGMPETATTRTPPSIREPRKPAMGATTTATVPSTASPRVPGPVRLQAQPSRAPRVSTATFTYGKPTLAWTGETFGVAWIQPDGPATGIYFAQVDSDGVRIGPDVRVFSTVCATSLSLAWNGVEYALAWSECYPDSPILFGRFSASGVLSAHRKPLHPASGAARRLWSGRVTTMPSPGKGLATVTKSSCWRDSTGSARRSLRHCS